MKTTPLHQSFHGLLFAAVLMLPTTAPAQSELFKPYNLHIIVHVAEDRLLTEVFRKRIERELRDGFQAALGDMGRVTVTDKHPRLADVLTRGLRVLDDWKDRNDLKTHFVLIDYVGGYYEIQARQYDGTMGLASPVVRRDRTRDRDFVAKAAALLIKHDFGILGTVQTEPEGVKEQVKVELRGGGLGDMTPWVKKNDVFTLAPPSGGVLASLKWSLLQVEQAPAEGSRDGICVCRFFHRYQIKSIAGYRCMKLGTVQAPLRLRWVQRTPNGRIKPLNQRLTVEIRRYGFDDEETTKLSGKQSEPNGVLETLAEGKDGIFNNVAFVRVLAGPVEPKPQVPIALVDDQPIFIEVNAAADTDASFTIHKTEWQNKVADSVQMQASLFKRLEALGADPKNRSEILAIAISGMKRAEADRTELLKEREELLNEAKKIHKDLKTPIEDRRLQQLEDYKQALAIFVAEQKKIEEKENDPQRKKWLAEIENAKLLEKELEIDKAIAIYERVQKEGFNDAELSKHLAELHKKWDLRNDEHKEARNFIYRVWPTLDLSRLEDNIPKAQKAFQTCKNVHDLYSIQKLLKGTEGHADRLNKRLAELAPQIVAPDAKEEQELKPVSEKIAKLGEEIQEYLKTQ
jgi:hypothetical protein